MLVGQEKEALGNVMEDSLLAPTSTEDAPRTLRKFKRTQRMVDGGSSPQSQNASYRDRLVGLIRPNNRLGRIGMLNMLMETVVSGAHAFFSVEEKREMHKPWRTALIVKLLGKILGIKALSSKVQQLWRLEGNYKIIDLDNDYFLFKLNRNHIIIMSWNEPSCDKIEFLIAWVHFSKLPLEYYTVMAVWRIVSCVGRVICIDWNTEDVQRGGFARVCIDLDLTKLSCSSVSLGKCGKFGHRKDSCPMSTIAASGTDKVLSSSTHVASDMPSKMPLQLMGTSFGPWMLVQGKTCKPVRDPISNGKSSIGSDFRHDVRRFFALNHAVDDSRYGYIFYGVGGCVGVFKGIRVLWKLSVGSVEVVCRSRQFISLIIDGGKKLFWALTAVHDFSDFDFLPWLLIGDFNQILSLDGKQSGTPESFRRMDQFRDVMITKQLIQLDASGCKFTWSNDYDRQLAQLLHIRHDHEIHETLNSMVPWKSPGPDGFQAGFYQLVVRHSLCTFVRNTFMISSFDESLSRGQKFNYSKSLLFTSPNVLVEVVKGIASCSKIFHCTDLGHYLGVPLHSGHITKHTYAYLLDKLKKPLASWKANQLSLVGRAILVQSIQSSKTLVRKDCACLIGVGVATSFWYDKWLGNGSIMENFAVDVSSESYHLNVKDVVWTLVLIKSSHKVNLQLLNHRVNYFIAWSRPPPSSVKMNVDATVTSNPGGLAMGGLCQDNDGS
ncbi:hypothetical protein GOBAR_AA36382 [Gossypium barbadense]|uniref:Uncharacterized protein n=1 Tax=Gossypium barbadense TaxID=3634 RepID=A0A2P5VZR3_GOSBA|nr:hypothetical protein GOBAR_AA36382 [Gossypium barbadense]